jgi:tetratricopeptide (TPR) repeat protein
VRQTLYDEIRVPERVRLHRRVGEALEETHGASAEAPLSELAHHFFEAAPGGDSEKAIAYGLRAAKRAQELLAYEEGARLHERTLELLDPAIPRDEPRRFETLVAAGTAHDAAGARQKARRRFAEAAATARQLGRRDLLARAAIGYRGFGEMGVPPEPETLALLEEARDALGDAEPALRSRLLSLLTGTPPYSLSMERRNALSGEALALARESGDPAALRDALGARSWACLGPDRVAERFEVGRELLALAERLGDRLTATVAHEYLFGAHLLVGDTAAADQALRQHALLAGELRRPFLRFMSSFLRGSRAVCAGRFDEAELLFRQALELGRGTVRFADVTYGGQMYWLQFQRGRLEELTSGESFLRDVVERWPGVGPLVRSALALVAVGQGRDEAAQSALDAIARHDFADLEHDEHWLLTLVLLSDVAFLVEDRRRAALLYDLLAPFAELVALHDLLRTFAGPVASVLGELATLLERWEIGIAHFEKAIAKSEAMGALHSLLGSRAGLARLLRRRGRPADRRRAEALVKEVEQGAAALGIQGSARYERYLRRDL